MLKCMYVPKRAAYIWKKRAEATWKSDPVLDKVIQWECSINVVRKVMRLLSYQDGPIMSMYELSRYKMKRVTKDKIKQVVVKFPEIFRFRQDKEGEFWVDFTPVAEDIIKQEMLAIATHDEKLAVDILKKLLMMARDHRIGLEKLGHLKHEYLFPDDFKEKLLPKHPDYFKVVLPPKAPGQGYVQLVGWDSSLAVTVREKTAPPGRPYAFQVDNRVGGGRKEVEAFQELPFISPYEDPGLIDIRTLEAEKRAVAVLHEILSLMPMKKSVVGRLVLLKQELQLPTGFVDMAEVFNWIFYVSRVIPKEKTIFVREAFEKGELKAPNYLSTAKSRIKELMKVTYNSGPNMPPKTKLKIDEEDIEDISDFCVSYVGNLRDL